MNLERIKRFLSLPIISAAVIIISIAAKIFIQYYYLNIDNDKSYQILAAQNFLKGNGFSLLEVYANDLSSSSFVPLIKWPPGYSFLLSPFLVICKNDIILSTLLLDILTCILFTLFARKLLFANSLPAWLVNIYTLIAGFFFYSFCTASSSDFLTLSIFIIALFYTLKTFRSDSLQPWQLIFISLLLFLTAFTRYMYIPVALALPAVLIFCSLFNHNRLLMKKGFIVLGITSILILLFLLIQYTYADSAVYIRNADKGFFIENLKKFHPVIFSSILNLDFATITLSSVSGKSFNSISQVLSILHFVTLFVLFIVITKWVINKKMIFSTVTDIYLFTGIVISLVIILTLVSLSLRNSLYLEYGFGGWTYVQEGRYFAFFSFFIQQALFIIAFQYRKSLYKWVKILLFFILIMAGLDMLHNMYYTAKVVATQKKLTHINKNSIDLFEYTDSITKKIISDTNGKKVIVISQPAHYGAQAGFHQPIPALYIYSSLHHLETKTKEAVKVLFITTNLENMPVSFVTNPSKKIVGNYNKYIFYTVDVEPNQP